MFRPGEVVAITGSSRGIGLGLCAEALRHGAGVAALARDPARAVGLGELAGVHGARIEALACDVTDAASLRAASASVAHRFGRVDVLIANAGISGRTGQDLAALDLGDVRDVFDVDVLGPLRTVRAFLPLLRRGERRLIVHVGSLMGSIADNGSGGWWAYRIAKAALNMASRNLAHELRDDGIASVVVHPGWVRTGMGGSAAPLSVEASAAALMRTVLGLGLGDSGRFVDRDGADLPW